MTEKEWLEQSDEEKDLWIALNISGDYPFQRLSWQGFGMIVEKAHKEIFSKRMKFKKYLQTAVSNRVVPNDAALMDYSDIIFHVTAEDAALAYGKMKGLIE